MMTINDQIKNEKLQYNINREEAKISALSSGKLHKYGYITGEDILPSTQQPIIEQTKFTYSPFGRAFEKQIKTIEDQGKKQVDASVALKDNTGKSIKVIEDKSVDKNDQSKTSKIFNDLIEKKRKKILNKLYEDVAMNKLYFKCKGSTKDVNFNEYHDSRQLFNGIIIIIIKKYI